MKKSTFKVIIAGAGLGGLCLAQGLAKAGIEFEVFERDATSTSRPQGFRIQINPDGNRALHACLHSRLYTEYVATCGRLDEGLTFATEDLRELLSLRWPADPPDVVDAYRSASRSILRRVLLDGIGDRIHFNKRFVRYEKETGGKITAYFDDGSSVTGDLLVGADGVNSGVRKQFLPNADAVDTGVLGIGARMPLSEPVKRLLGEKPLSSSTLILGRGGRGMWISRQIFNQAGEGDFADDTEDYAYWGLMARWEDYGFKADPAKMDGKSLRDHVLGMIRDWHPRLHEFIGHSDTETASLWPMRSGKVIDPWPAASITLIGDAIHSMPPTGGVGGNTALRDAQNLSEQLAAASRGEKALADAVAEYESAMFVYGFDTMRESLRLLGNATSHNPACLAFTKAFFRTVNRFPPLKRQIFMKP